MWGFQKLRTPTCVVSRPFAKPFAALSGPFATEVKTHVHICRCHSDTQSLAWHLEWLPRADSVALMAAVHLQKVCSQWLGSASSPWVCEVTPRERLLVVPQFKAKNWTNLFESVRIQHQHTIMRRSHHSRSHSKINLVELATHALKSLWETCVFSVFLRWSPM